MSKSAAKAPPGAGEPSEWRRRRPVVLGRLALLIGLATVPVAVIGSWTGFWFINAALVVAWLIDLARVPRPWSITVAAPQELITRIGNPVPYEITLVNRSRRRMRLSVRVVWRPSVAASESHFKVDIPTDGATAIGLDVTPRRGGSAAAGPVAVRSNGPWRLAGWQADSPQPTILMARPAHPSARLLPAKLAILASADGRTAIRQRGEGTEFDALRDYVRGDDRRSIDWRATARAQKLVVRTWQPERDRRLLVVLDCGRLSAARFGDDTRLAIFIDALLLLTAVAGHAGDSVDVIAYSREVRRQVSARGRSGVTGKVGAAFTGLVPDMIETDYRGLGREILRRTRQRQAVVLMTSLSAHGAANRLLPTLRSVGARNPTLLAHVNSDWPTTPIDALTDAYQAAVAELSAQRLAETAKLLATNGIASQIANPNRFATLLTDRYLQWRLGAPTSGWMPSTVETSQFSIPKLR